MGQLPRRGGHRRQDIQPVGGDRAEDTRRNGVDNDDRRDDYSERYLFSRRS
jgi:hypothetical protein